MEHEGQRNLSEFLNSIYIGVQTTRPHFFLGGVLTWGRRVPASALPSWGSMPQLGNKKMYCICLSRHRALTSKCRRGDASPPSEDPPQKKVRTLPQCTYIYTRGISVPIYTCGIIPFMFCNTKHKKIILIICSFKAEQVLLPCYSFPAKKSLKKVSFFKSLVYNVLRI